MKLFIGTLEDMENWRMLRRPCGTGKKYMEVARRVAVFVEEREHGGGDVGHGVVRVFWRLNGVQVRRGGAMHGVVGVGGYYIV